METNADEIREKIKRLYNLYANDGDEILLSTINEYKAKYSELIKRIEIEKERAKAENSKMNTADAFRDIESMWDFMSMHEKQVLLRGMIDKVIVGKDTIELKMKL